MERHELHRWLFRGKDGRQIRFEDKSMPFAVFKDDAVWGGSCQIGDAQCRIRIRHTKEGEKGKHLEVWFPDKEFGEKVSFESATLVGYVKIVGSWKLGTGMCLFKELEDENKSTN